MQVDGRTYLLLFLLFLYSRENIYFLKCIFKNVVFYYAKLSFGVLKAELQLYRLR